MIKRFRKSLLSVVVFLTGASVLIIEVVAVRVLSPYYGNTIFTVSSVISVILLALSVGYYAGGRLADRHPSLSWFFGLILASGLVVLLFYFAGTLVLPILSAKLSISIGPLASAALLFLLPALLLGTLSPYAVKLQSAYVPEQGVGSVAGSIFFWSTLGSIMGSLLAGFVLIPRFGIDRILIATGILLFILGLLPLLVLGVEKKQLSKAVIVFVVVLGASGFALRRSGGHAIYRKDGIYEKITIYEDTYAGRPVRFFQQDRTVSGGMFLDSTDPADLVYGYTKFYSLYKVFTPRLENALVIGGGAYSIPKALLQAAPNATVDVAEIEPSLVDLATKYFQLKETPRLHNHVEDGRRLLHDSHKNYDLIFSDVYYSLFSVPPHFTTKEFLETVKSRLSTDGVFIANMIGNLSRQQPSLIMAEMRTFQDVFPNTYFFAVESPERTDLQNIILIGSNSSKRVDFDSPSIAKHPDPVVRFVRYKLIDVNHRFDLSPYPVLTDNFSPVEYLTSKVLQRAFREAKDVDGSELVAVADQQYRYGPRDLGSPGHQKVKDFLLAEMNLLAQDVAVQSWKHTTPEGKTYDLTNIIGRLHESEERRVVLATHYDHKRFSGDAGARSNRLTPGANDSASSVAMLVELARTLINSPVPPKVGVDIVFFDGEEGDNDQAGDGSDWKPLGSTYFAAHLNELYGHNKPLAAIVLDAGCDKNLRIVKEQSSVDGSPALVDAFWNAARRLDGRVFQNRVMPALLGDHTPLNQAGIPSILVIDSEYPHYDKGGKTPEKCSAGDMEAVGHALLYYLTGAGV